MCVCVCVCVCVYVCVCVCVCASIAHGITFLGKNTFLMLYTIQGRNSITRSVGLIFHVPMSPFLVLFGMMTVMGLIRIVQTFETEQLGN